ncbi:metalloregulator ArsR/SmtB family transcription factor [Belnapia sp. T18]|uniref:Metalloregulator ArsR/SmtB family transcription factor n=1 Tax=Belnapia arida TaxID=2804533 RepID=A0ABS1UAS7_9PROT|nr:metalloregulator ArsR/SmtB family transcription factor [Belnapia arida]MBL6080782.1 metalloregulator ArsR/SmtB family transcription factor [Belnapia arida]
MESSTAADVFAALGQESRLELLRALLEAGPSGLSAGAIGTALGIVPSTLSFHLRALEQVGLIRPTRQGRSLIYAVQVDRLRQTIAFLTESCCGGQPELCGALTLPMLASSPENSPMKPAFNVLFLCTRNSARSLMAEAVLRKLGGDRFRAYSAGSDPAPQPMPEVVEKLKTLGHDVSGIRSKSWQEFLHREAPRMDFVIALCDTLQGQNCPDFGDRAITASWPLPGPGKFEPGSSERVLLLNELYASLHRRIGIFTNLKFDALDRMSLRHQLDDLAQAPLSVAKDR